MLIASVLGALACSSLLGCDSRRAEDSRVRTADQVLSPPWRKGSTWTLEVHGSSVRDKWVKSFWGVTHFAVDSVDDERAVVNVWFHPVIYNGLIAGDCTSRLHFELRPWRLVRVELEDAAGDFVFRAEGAAPKPGTSPCIPFLPRHPDLLPRSVVQPREPQQIPTATHEVVFAVRGDLVLRGVSRVMRWRMGDPWWSKLETVDGEGHSLFGGLGHKWRSRRADGAIVERARLIAIDGHAVRPEPWGVAAEGSRFDHRYANSPESDGLGPDGLLDGSGR